MEDDAAHIDQYNDDGRQQERDDDGRQEPRQPQAILGVHIFHCKKTDAFIN